MKLHSARYGATAMFGTLSVSIASIAAQTTEAKWIIACIGAFLVGFVCTAIVPFEQKGD